MLLAWGKSERPTDYSIIRHETDTIVVYRGSQFPALVWRNQIVSITSGQYCFHNNYSEGGETRVSVALRLCCNLPRHAIEGY